ncbi:nuclear transport factor 2 family protein [Denitrobaculum tricleocarpae]|uniref:nuclear transport factor 2 family protein n=1 Tax=Denitrobaculum tricleocarpae TaxID=2591009 RepID=UPI0015D2D0F7|nr:nuclear transport factor 2 family protein [Denitrobaculum tricleocarpae]
MTEQLMIETLVRAIFDAYRKNDSSGFLERLHPDFRFTSPYDDAIDSDSFMERCWPGHHQVTDHRLRQIFTDGETAFVHYEFWTATGDILQNVERLVFRKDLLFSIEVFFGDPPAGQGRWKNEDIKPAAAVRKLISDRYQSIRDKDGDGTMSAVSDTALMFDVVEPLCHTDASDMRQRMKEWFDKFDGPVKIELKDLVVSADGDTAFAHSLNRYKGTFKAGGSTDMWVRHTSCYRLKEDGWQLVHEHLSVPFDVHTGKWSLDLQPA